MSLSKDQRAALTKIRAAGNSALDDRLDDSVCSYLLAVVVSDLGLVNRFPELPSNPPPFFTSQPPSSLRVDGVEFLPLYERFLGTHEDAQAYFSCLAKLHKSRLKYERILRSQPLPTLDQVGPRGLLQYGSLSPRALAGLLFWRKWLFDIDNRAGQETGYLFEPIIAHAIGGVPFGARRSPIKRIDKRGGRQVDAICDETHRAYEFKLRVTIASSGQGRWKEELNFPAEAKGSGYVPVLVVLDPTDNEKLRDLSRAFVDAGGLVYTGEAAWGHLRNEAGVIMSRFIETYVKGPLESLLREAPEKLPSFLVTLENEHIRIAVGNETVDIHREPVADLASGEDQLPDDIDEEFPTP
jgi:hypothetical protein